MALGIPQTLAAVMVLVAAVSARGAERASLNADLVTPSLLADVEAVAPGTSFTLGVRLVMKPHWHTYWVNPGEAGDATKIVLTGPPGFEFGAIQWPLPTRIAAPGGVSFGYEGEVLLLVPVKVAPGASAGSAAAIAADVRWLSCKETCVEGRAKLSLSLPVGSAPKPANQALFNEWRQRLPVSQDQPAAAKILSPVRQVSADDGTPAATIDVHWTHLPAKVEWFPVATRAAAVEDVALRHDGQRTEIRFKPTVYKPDAVPGGRLDSVLVYEDVDGRRRGISVPFAVAKSE